MTFMPTGQPIDMGDFSLGPQIQVPKRGGMFGAGKMDVAGAIQAAIGGYLAGRGIPGGAAILGMANQRRQQAEAQQQYQQQREDGFQDWVRRQAWEVANKPNTQQPHRWESNDGSLMELGPNGPRVVYKDPTPRLQAVPNGLGGVMFVNPQQFMGGQQGLPQTLSDSDWETEGGPTPSASGGFQPGRY